MDIQYLAPLQRAWARMTAILFPFDIRKWFALGFTAFLAHLFDMHGGGGRGGGSHGEHVDWDRFFDLPWQAQAWMSEHPLFTTAIAVGIVLAIALAVVLLWLSSRGTFMFLDNVVHNRSLIQKPWHEFKAHASSLFLWRLLLGIFAFIMFSEFAVAGFFIARNMYYRGAALSSNVLLLLGLAFIGFSLLVILLTIARLLKDFIAPIMYRDNLPVKDAWEKFAPLFSAHVGAFVLYILFLIVLYIVTVICISIAGVITLGVGFVILIIPYIGSVLLLPVSVTFRALSIEFLGQFGDDFRIFPAAVSVPPSPGAEPALPLA